MAHVISVATLKGGVGKTTISLTLGTCLQALGMRVLLVDANSEQGSLAHWAEHAAEMDHDVPPVVGITGKRLTKEIAALGAAYDVVIVDSAPAGSDARAAMVCADLVLMPIAPGSQEVQVLQKTLALLDEAQSLRPEIKARLLFNLSERTQLAAQVQRAISGLPVELMETVLRRRVTFGEATATGQGVVTYAPESDAAAEARRLTKEVLEVLRG